MSAPAVFPVQLSRLAGGQVQHAQPDLLAVEEPLEIRLGFGPAADREQRSLAITMRTPGHDFELAAGFLLTESLVQTPDDIRQIQYCADVGRAEQRGNVVRVELAPHVAIDFERLARHFYTTSSCGVCGKTSIEAVQAAACLTLPPPRPLLTVEVLTQLPARLRTAQAVFEHTGGLHAAALFDAEGQLILLREDVGRHNALDKLIGAALYRGWLPLHQHVLLVSGRASFELVQKALTAGLPLLAAVGAPSSLAVQLAQDAGMTVVGFLRHDRANIYCGEARIVAPVPAQNLETL